MYGTVSGKLSVHISFPMSSLGLEDHVLEHPLYLPNVRGAQ